MVKGAVVVGSLAVAIAGITLAREAGAQVPPLSALPVPGPANLADFVSDPGAAKVLGKALFWDMQVGSDGVQACATCHFRAGADPRSKNQISPGFLRVAIKPGPVVVSDPDFDFEGWDRTTGSAERISPSGSSQIPWIASRQSPRTRTTWCPRRACTMRSLARRAGRAPTPMAFRSDRTPKANVRRVEPRNTPTMINAVFNHRNFWDLRAQNLFNGVSPFGNRDANAFLYRADDAANPRKTTVSLICLVIPQIMSDSR